ncbi:cysteine synthase A [Granulicella mallensis]|uniref:Cysteine synthase n=1 Tax=Granulicella mallensis (strain ATCC BAA-1857 / DSM 23137 / MP5ACTX8) TaxID=682795 RepID=G8NYS5_GRAMM|nr:cysteine synthase A [Granulicella mallensis]AEU34488.1 cysteine synthase [Granulicella mallensis MP5ACTX8]
MIYENVTCTVGRTPIVELARLSEGMHARLLAKLEMRNPCGSVKDRVALAMIEAAEARGAIVPGATLIEATAGNTGIGLACAAAVKGYRLILVMPEAMSEERAKLLRHLGADIRLTPGILVADAVVLAKHLHRQIPGAFLVDQFNNPANIAVHRRTTAEEIWTDTGGVVDVFVAAVGTAGTLMGVAGVLKERKPGVRIVAVEPAASAVLSGGVAGQHRIPGIGVGFVPPLYDQSLVDEVIAVSNEDAFATARLLAKREGISSGVSAGAALHASLQVMRRPELAGRTVVTILPDTGDRYASSGLFED